MFAAFMWWSAHMFIVRIGIIQNSIWSEFKVICKMEKIACKMENCLTLKNGLGPKPHHRPSLAFPCFSRVQPSEPPVRPMEPSWTSIAYQGQQLGRVCFEHVPRREFFPFRLIPTETYPSLIEESKSIGDQILFEIRPKPLYIGDHIARIFFPLYMKPKNPRRVAVSSIRHLSKPFKSARSKRRSWGIVWTAS
jgi:hypothetical protein